MKVVQHLTDSQLRSFAQGEAGIVEFEFAEQHLAECDACCQRLAAEPENTLLSLARAALTLQGAKRPGRAADRCVPIDLLEHPRYKILEQIGSGGMGAVFRAEHRLMQRTVALKLVHPWLLSNTQAVERFEREVRMAARLSHPNIVVAYDADRTEQRHFLVMEYVEGETLQQRVKCTGPVSVQQACNWVMQVATGLEHAHEQGMTHRDIKPQNLMITRDGRIRILDFGLSRIAADPMQTPVHPPDNNYDSSADTSADPSAVDGTPTPKITVDPRAPDEDSANWDTNCCSIARTDASLILGTPDYIAPEQIDSSASVDVRADIYSLGCTLFFLLTGKPPFHTNNIAETLHGQRYGAIPNLQLIRPDVPDSLVCVLNKMTAKRVEERYNDPREVHRALASVVAEQTGRLSHEARAVRDQEPASNADVALVNVNQRGTGSRRKLLVGTAIGLMVLLLAGLAPLLWPARPLRFLVALPADGLWYPDYEELIKATEKFSRRVQLVFVGTQERPSNVFSTSKPGIAVPDVMLSNQIKAANYDGMIFIGYLTQEFSPQSGPVGEETARLIREFQLQKKVLGGLCAGQRILAQHGAVRGKRIAPCESIRDEEITVEGGSRGTDDVEADGLVVTAASAAHAEKFLKKMIEAENH